MPRLHAGDEVASRHSPDDNSHRASSLSRPLVCPIGRVHRLPPRRPAHARPRPPGVASSVHSTLWLCSADKLACKVPSSPSTLSLSLSTCRPSHWETVHGFSCVLHILILQRLLSSSSSSSLCHCYCQWQPRRRRRNRSHSLHPPPLPLCGDHTCELSSSRRPLVW